MAWASIAVPVVTSVIQGAMGSSASSGSASTLSGATDRATAAQERMFDKQIELQKPFRDVGVSANNRLAHLLGIARDPSGSTAGMTYEQLFEMADADHRQKYGVGIDQIDPNVAQQWKDAIRAQATSSPATVGGDNFGSLMRDFGMADFEADPGYSFRKSEGMKGIESGAAARGGLLSGAALKAIQKYGQDLASQEYGNAYGRFTANQTNKYNRLAGLVNTGQGASNTLTNAAGNLGNAIAGNITAAGNAKAAGQVGSANAWSNAIGGISNLYQQNELMKMIRNPSSGGFGTGTGYGNQDYGLYF